VLPSAEPRSRPPELLLFALGVVGVLLAVGWLAAGLGSNVLSDVHAYYDAAARLNAGQPLYDQAATTNDAEFYRYPPLLAVLFRPLATLPFDSAAAIWETVVVLSLAGLIVLLRPGFRGWLLFGMVAMCILWSVAIGQAQVPVTLLVAIGAPWSIALAAQVKVLPALIALWWIGRRDWRSLGRFAVWSAALVVVQLILEPSGSLAFPGVFNLGQVGEVRNWSPYVVSPWLWLALVAAGVVITLRLAPTRWGWAAAVVLSVFATPRLLLYQLMTLTAALRTPSSPQPAAEPAPEGARGPATDAQVAP